MIWVASLAAALALLAGVSYLISSLFAEKLAHPHRRTYEEALTDKDFMKRIDGGRYSGAIQKDFTLHSDNGYELSGKMFLQPGWEGQKPRRAVVLCHGWTSNMVFISDYYSFFFPKGFNVFVYDHRYHGRSGGEFCTMGLHEHEDLIQVCSYVRSLMGEDCRLGIMGESMGAATVMLAAPKVPGLAFAIEDCGYSTLRDEVIFVGTKLNHMPKWPIFPLCASITKRRFGYDINAINPIDGVRASHDLPMLFLQGDKDNFVPSRMMTECFNAKEGFRMCRYFEGSGHARSHIDHPKEYRATIWEFLEKSGVLSTTGSCPSGT